MKLNTSTIIFFLLVFLTSNFIFSQEYSFQDYNWNEKDTKTVIQKEYENLNEVILDKTIKVEIVLQGQQSFQYYLVHQKTLINSNDAIEKNNKMYVPIYENESIVTNKVRVILKNGKIINLDQKDIKEEIDQEKQMKFNYFAINGLEIGAIIEKLLVLKETSDLKGKTFVMQEEFPIANLNFELIFPEHLVFKNKSYNGLSEAKIDTEKIKGKHIISISEQNITALLNDEKYSNWHRNLKMFRYKLDENLISGVKNLNSYKEFATNLFERLNSEYDKKEQNAIVEFCKQISKSADQQEQIWNIENKLKKTIVYDKYTDSKEKISNIIKSKQANQTDILRLYIAIFKNFGIENNLVLTSDRFKIPFDKEFESFENLQEVLVYFPKINKYLTPTEIEYRIPLFPKELGNNNGLFTKEKKFAGINMGISEIKFIEIPGIEITHDEMDIIIDFTKDLDNPKIRNRISFGGYSAFNFQPVKDFVPADEYKTILKTIAQNYTIDTEYTTLTTQNDGIENIGKKPFILEVTFDGKDLIQKAGENYLFSIGQIIGKQSELYHVNKRKLPVEIDYPHAYTRKIKIILPKGITIKNLEKISMNKVAQINNKTEAYFICDYKKTDSEITIENTQNYNVIDYPLEKFTEYKQVINAAADFNKIVIILNK